MQKAFNRLWAPTAAQLPMVMIMFGVTITPVWVGLLFWLLFHQLILKILY